MMKKAICVINKAFLFVDGHPLWWACLIMFAILLLPHLSLGVGSVFDIHDQMDESMMNYVLTARHFGASTIPEMMNGINASGLEPSAILFIPLFWLFSPFQSMLIAYFFLFFACFLGMYFLVRELTESSILALVAAGLFSMLPFYPVYGLSEAGIPMILYACICLYRKKNKIVSFLLIALFGLTSHLVCTGYAVLLFWAIFLLAAFLKKGRKNYLPAVGFSELLAIYAVVNFRLISEFLFGRSAYVSHRVEMVNYPLPFFKAAEDVFINGQIHAPSYHWYLIIPVLILLAAGGIFYRRFGKTGKDRYVWAVGVFLLIVAIALFYGFCKTEWITGLKNRADGFLHYFQFDRFYWISPALWYLDFALAASVFWTGARENAGEQGKIFWIRNLILYSALLILLILPTAILVLHNSTFYKNVNQYNNGSEITSYISWESFYSEDLMQKLDNAIGKDKTVYRVAHLGISPAPALMHGFYTIDGYSNNYPLEYKHSFRKVIAKELDKNQEARIYFDDWGNRCYLFNSVSGAEWMAGKGNGFLYSGLEFDMAAMKELGCEYIFSCAQVEDAERMGLEFMGYFDTPKSYWGIWLYHLN